MPYEGLIEYLTLSTTFHLKDTVEIDETLFGQRKYMTFLDISAGFDTVSVSQCLCYKGHLEYYVYESILDMGCVSIVCHLVTKHSVSHE